MKETTRDLIPGMPDISKALRWLKSEVGELELALQHFPSQGIEHAELEVLDIVGCLGLLLRVLEKSAGTDWFEVHEEWAAKQRRKLRPRVDLTESIIELKLAGLMLEAVGALERKELK